MADRQPSNVTTEFYLTFEPRWRSNRSWWMDEDGNPILEGARCTRVTQSRPTSMPRGGGVVVKFSAKFKAQTFLPLMPKAVLEIDPASAEIIDIKVEEPDSE